MDIGKDLLKKPYEQIRNSLKKYGISTKLRYRLKYYLKFIDNLEISFDTIMQYEKLPEDLDKSKLSTICYTFIQWALDGKMQGNGYGFPFDKPHFHFYERLCVMYSTLKKMENEMNAKSDRNGKTIRYLINDLQPLIEDVKAEKDAADFLQKNEVFEKLRLAMRIASTNSKEGLNDGGENEDIKTIEQKTVDFRSWLVNDKIYKGVKAYHKMIEQIDKYWEKLFADPITLKTPNGEITVQPQRTNNILEQFFRGFKRNHRRTSGNSSMAKKLQTMFADTTLVKNLDNPEYMNIIHKNHSEYYYPLARLFRIYVRDLPVLMFIPVAFWFFTGEFIARNILLSSYIIAISIIGFIGFGYIYAGMVIHMKRSGLISNLVQFVLMIFGAVFYPFSALPENILVISKIIPFSYYIDAFRASIIGIEPELITKPLELGGITLQPLLVELIIIHVFSAIFFLVGILVYKKSVIKAKKEGTLHTY